MLFGSIRRSRNQIEEQSANRSSSVTPKVVFAANSARTWGCVSRVGRHAVVGGTNGDRPQTFPVRRCLFQRPCERGQRAAARPTRDVVLWKDGLHLVPERARLPGAALVRRGLAH